MERTATKLLGGIGMYLAGEGMPSEDPDLEVETYDAKIEFPGKSSPPG